MIFTCVTSKLVFQLTAAPHPMRTRNIVPISSATKARARSRQLSGISEYEGAIWNLGHFLKTDLEQENGIRYMLQNDKDHGQDRHNRYVQDVIRSDDIFCKMSTGKMCHSIQFWSKFNSIQFENRKAMCDVYSGANILLARKSFGVLGPPPIQPSPLVPIIT